MALVRTRAESTAALSRITMTVKELITELSRLDADLPVYVESYIGPDAVTMVSVHDAWRDDQLSGDIQFVGTPRGEVFKAVIVG
jgi:hypothetical protein